MINKRDLRALKEQCARTGDPCPFATAPLKRKFREILKDDEARAEINNDCPREDRQDCTFAKMAPSPRLKP